MGKTPLNSILEDKVLSDEIKRRVDGGPGLAKAALFNVPKETLMPALEEAPPPEETPTEVPPLAEAIILEVGRPSLLVRNGSFELPESDVWKARLNPTKPRLEQAIRSVGRLELLDHDTYPWVGTAWMVTEDIAVTNRHVAMIFAQKKGKKFTFSHNAEGKTVRGLVDFKEEYKQAGSMEVDIVSVVFIEDSDDTHPDMAFVRMKKDRNLPPPITLSTSKLDDLLAEDRYIAAVGYPARDSRNDADVMLRIFGDIYGVKRFAPGKLTSNRDGYIITHDCSTLGGNSGSVLIDVATGEAVGLHFGGQYKTSNYAVKAGEILKVLASLKIQVPVPAIPKNGRRPGETAVLEEAAPKPEDYSDRKGYAPDFLGPEKKYKVPLPALSQKQVDKAAKISHPAGADDKGSYILNYTHFSLAVNGERKLPYFTASNIDGNQLRRFARVDNWVLDPRINKNQQAGPEVYANNDLDRGHMVRRLDPVWGSEAEARLADADTFHFTNACPQHKDLNQKTWEDLEDYVLNNTANNRLKVLVFTGPVLRDTDPPYRSVKLPLEFWKIAVMVKDDKKLSATAYMESQADLLSNLEGFAFGQFKTYQVTIKRIEDLTGLDFGDLRKFDPLAAQEGFDVRVINGPEDLVL